MRDSPILHLSNCIHGHFLSSRSVRHARQIQRGVGLVLYLATSFKVGAYLTEFTLFF
jgi:hypothetical protein